MQTGLRIVVISAETEMVVTRR